MPMKRMLRRVAAFAAALTVSLPLLAADAPEVLATVNGRPIEAAQFQETFTRAVRDKFYHGTVPTDELRKHSHVVLRQMIDDILLAEEAKKRKIRPDSALVEQTLGQYERQYQNSAQWKQNRDKLLPGLREAIEQRSLRTRLEESVRKVRQPGEAEVEAFYKGNLGLFTEPERVRISAIMLKVDPSSPSAVWTAALDEGQRIRKQLDKGGKFAELARLHSGHESASRGGDMGYIHKGMLAEDATAAIDRLKVGETTEAFRSLEGVLIIRLDERVPPAVRKFADVRERATELLVRERREKAWDDFREALYQGAEVSLDGKRYPDFADFALPAGKKPQR